MWLSVHWSRMRGVEDVAPYRFVRSRVVGRGRPARHNGVPANGVATRNLVGGDLRTPRAAQCLSRKQCGYPQSWRGRPSSRSEVVGVPRGTMPFSQTSRLSPYPFVKGFERVIGKTFRDHRRCAHPKGVTFSLCENIRRARLRRGQQKFSPNASLTRPGCRRRCRRARWALHPRGCFRACRKRRVHQRRCGS